MADPVLDAIKRLCDVESYADVPQDDLARYGKIPAYAKVYNLKKAAQTFAEVLDNVRAALKLESTHYLVIADQVAEVVRERDALRKRAPKPPTAQHIPLDPRHGPYCRYWRKVRNQKVFCGLEKEHAGPHEFVRAL